MRLFFIVFLSLLLLANAYVAWHFWRILPFSSWVKWASIAVVVLSFACLFFSLSPLLDSWPMGVSSVIYQVGTGWLIVLLYLVMLFLLLDIGRLVRLVPSPFLKDSIWGTIFVVVLIGGLLIYGNIHYYNKYRETISLKTAKPLSRPVKAVLMSDLHLGYHNRRGELHLWVDMIIKEKPDFVLIAGDIIDRSIRPLEEDKMADEFKRINVPVIACLGNHEYYAGEPNSLAFYKEAGITLLRDSSVVVDSIQIIGRDDRSNLRRKKTSQLVENTDKGKYTILLDHQPYNLEDSEQNGIDFQLSGHTHHGQVWPISMITERVYECAFGSWKRGNTNYYVSSGIGIWGGKFRIGTRSEYVVATITN